MSERVSEPPEIDGGEEIESGKRKERAACERDGLQSRPIQTPEDEAEKLWRKVTKFHASGGVDRLSGSWKAGRP